MTNVASPMILNLVTPKNISAIWSFGSLLGLCLVTQIVTGLFLAIFFSCNIRIAFDSAIYISRDVNYGWLIRSIHANGASIFFILLYVHVGRGLYYGSFFLKETWTVGVTLFLLVTITAFLGYVLPWGQISYWAATVITNLLSAIPYLGPAVVEWLWGGFSVRNATLTRFYCLHFILPFLIALISIVHIFLLHGTGSNNPLGVSRDTMSLKFHPYFTIKDLVGILVIWAALGRLVLFKPNLFIDPENFIPANALVTPTHIQPEWYFLPMYAILRSIPRKLGGVIALIISIAILYFLPIFSNSIFFKVNRINVIIIVLFWNLCRAFFVLIWIGSKPVEYPFERIGQVYTFLYFSLYGLMFLVSNSEI